MIERLRAPLEAVKTVYENLKTDPEIELCHKPDTGILCFRLMPSGFTESKLDNLQTYIFERIIREGRRSISSTRLDEKQVLRIVAISPGVTSEAIMETISIVKEMGKMYNSSSI